MAAFDALETQRPLYSLDMALEPLRHRPRLDAGDLFGLDHAAAIIRAAIAFADACLCISPVATISSVPEPEQGVASDPKSIGKYDVVERIADGGFAVLYKGYDPFLKRSVAIKVCVSQDAELRQQFLREAEIAGQLDHPNIVRTFDFGFESAGPFLIQEYLEGEDLEHKIKRGDELSLRGKLGLLQEVAEGLAYSHDRGVLHLDIKPANIRLPEAVDGSSSGVKILDFGIARLASSGAEDKLDGMVGTAGYVPPEQISDGEVDARSDVFAFGAVAYELITHRRPFSGATVPELLKQVLEGRSLPLLQTWADCPESVAGLVDRCLESDPASRYQSFEDLLADLRSILAYFPAPEEAEEWVVVAAPEESLAADPSGVEEWLPEEQPLISELEDDGDEEAATAQPIEQGGGSRGGRSAGTCSKPGRCGCKRAGRGPARQSFEGGGVVGGGGHDGDRGGDSSWQAGPRERRSAGRWLSGC